MNYAELQDAILTFAARADMATNAPLCISLAEATIYRRTRTFEMETRATLSFLSPDYEAAVPEGWLGFKRMRVNDSPNPTAKYVGPDEFAGSRDLSPADFNRLVGEARLIYTVEAGLVCVNQPVGSSEPIEMECVYFKRHDALSVTASNALLTDHPDLFLWASLAAMWDLIDETEMVAKYTAKADRVIAELDDYERTRRRAAGAWTKSPPKGVIV